MATDFDKGMHKCPSCYGEGTVISFRKKKAPFPHTVGLRKCLRCRGTGLISSEQLAQYERGLKLRRERHRRGETLCEAARRLGTTPATVSRWEQGR